MGGLRREEDVPSEQDGLVDMECCAKVDQVEVGAVRIAEQKLQILEYKLIN